MCTTTIWDRVSIQLIRVSVLINIHHSDLNTNTTLIGFCEKLLSQIALFFCKVVQIIEQSIFARNFLCIAIDTKNKREARREKSKFLELFPQKIYIQTSAFLKNLRIGNKFNHCASLLILSRFNYLIIFQLTLLKHCGCNLAVAHRLHTKHFR